MGYDKRLRKLILGAVAAGDNVLVAGGQLGVGTGSIKVYQMIVSASAATTITPKSGTTIIAGSFTVPGLGAAELIFPDENTPYQECLPGQSLVWNSSAAVTLTGAIYFSIA